MRSREYSTVRVALLPFPLALGVWAVILFTAGALRGGLLATLVMGFLVRGFGFVAGRVVDRAQAANKKTRHE